MQPVHMNLITKEDLLDLLYLFHCYTEVVSLLEDELTEFDVRELFVEVFEEFECLLNYLICEFDQIISHSQHLISRICLSVHFCR